MDKDVVDPYKTIKERDSFIGVFDIYFSVPRMPRATEVRIVHWRWSSNAELFYLIADDGSVYNFHNIVYMNRRGD